MPLSRGSWRSSSMPTVADVMRRYGPAYLEQFGATMPAEHKKVLNAIMACRSDKLGTALYMCMSCGHWHVMGQSCGNRHCPTCQQDKTRAWLETQTDRLLPCPYFLLTFTAPAALCEVMRSHQRVAYAAHFDASSQAIKDVAADPKHIGAARCGLFGVLHIWGRTLEYHPHFTTSYRAEDLALMVSDGCRQIRISSSPCVFCRSCFELNSVIL
jgi:hypothetical protein